MRIARSPVPRRAPHPRARPANRSPGTRRTASHRWTLTPSADCAGEHRVKRDRSGGLAPSARARTRPIAQRHQARAPAADAPPGGAPTHAVVGQPSAARTSWTAPWSSRPPQAVMRPAERVHVGKVLRRLHSTATVRRLPPRRPAERYALHRSRRPPPARPRRRGRRRPRRVRLRSAARHRTGDQGERTLALLIGRRPRAGAATRFAASRIPVVAPRGGRGEGLPGWLGGAVALAEHLGRGRSPRPPVDALIML